MKKRWHKKYDISITASTHEKLIEHCRSTGEGVRKRWLGRMEPNVGATVDALTNEELDRLENLS